MRDRAEYLRLYRTTVKLIALLVRMESLSYEVFVRYWEEEHAPLVEGLPNGERYVTSLPTDSEKSPTTASRRWLLNTGGSRRRVRLWGG